MFTVNHLRKTYLDKNGTATDVLKDVNCTINKGDVVSIIGPSGTGKSTFLRALNMLEPPTAGEILFESKDITAKGYPLPALRRKVGMVFQHFNLFPHLSVIENVIFAPVKLLGMDEDSARKEARSLLKKVGLADKVNAMPGTLSGGQQQRVAIARCLAMKPEVLLMDEPTSALDPSNVGEVLSVMRQLATEKMTMLIVTHQLKFARDVSTRIFFMNEGVIYEQGSPDEIFNHPVHSATKNFVLGVKKLIFDIPDDDFDFLDMYSKMRAFCTKYSMQEKISKVLHVAEEMAQVALAKYRPLRVVISFTEMTGELAVAFMIKGMDTSPLQDDDIDELSMAVVRGMSREVIEETTSLGFRVKVLI